jgi:hypothetical protein
MKPQAVNRRMLAALKAVLPALDEDIRVLVECHSQLASGPNGTVVPVPDTIDVEVRHIHKRMVDRRDLVQAAIDAAEGVA